jgi:hypothetical protein
MTQIQKRVELMFPNTDPAYLASQGLSKTFPDRFWKKVDKISSQNGCWIWTGALHHGYGIINMGLPCHTGSYKPIGSHVAAWILCVGPIQEGLFVLHKCPGKHNPSCCNPAHLSLGDQKENSQDSIAQGTHWFSNNKVDNASKKLTDEQREEIRTKYATGKYKQWDLAHEYGVVQGTIWNVLNHIGG